MVRTGLFLAAGATLAMAASAAPTTARADLLDPLRITVSSPGATGPQAAITSSGWTLVVWNGADRKLRASWRPPGGRFGPEFALGTAFIGSDAVVATGDDDVVIGFGSGQTQTVAGTILLSPGETSGPTAPLASGNANAPKIAADAEGNAVAVASVPGALYGSLRKPGQEFGSPQLLRDQPTNTPTVAANPKGDFVISWSDSSGVVHAAVRPVGAAAFLPEERAPMQALFNLAAVTSGGDVALSGVGASPTALAIRPAGGTFGGPQTLTTDGLVHQLLTGADNGLSVIDQILAPGGVGGVLRLLDRRPDGTLSAPAPFSPDGSCTPDGVVTPKADTVIVYQEGCTGFAGNGHVALAERPRDGALTPSLRLSPADGQEAQIAVNPRGALAATWTAATPAGSVVQAVVRDGAAELGILAPGLTLPVSASGIVTLPVACSGLIDCVGAVEVLPAVTGATASAAARKPLGRRALRVRRGRGATVRVRLRGRPPARARLVVRLPRVKGKGATRVLKVRLRRGG